MDFFTYLTTPVAFGNLGWTLLVIQAGVALLGAYLAFVRGDNIEFRKELVKRFGLAALLLGAIGLIVGVTWMVNGLAQPLWLSLITLLELILAIYALIYWQTTYKTRLAEYQQSKSSKRRAAPAKPAVQQLAATATPVGSVSEAESAQPSRRREARRDRKRRNK